MSAERVELKKNTELSRYEVWLDGQRVGFAEYLRQDDVVVMPHTETDPAFGGRGLAGRLVDFALRDIDAQGLRVEPSCWFVAGYIRRNPQYQRLVANA